MKTKWCKLDKSFKAINFSFTFVTKFLIFQIFNYKSQHLQLMLNLFRINLGFQNLQNNFKKFNTTVHCPTASNVVISSLLQCIIHILIFSWVNRGCIPGGGWLQPSNMNYVTWLSMKIVYSLFTWILLPPHASSPLSTRKRFLRSGTTRSHFS